MTTESFIGHAQAMIDSAYEYATSHIDASDGYAHLAGEGGFDYCNDESRLQEYCEELGIDIAGIDLDRLAEDVIFWGYMTQGQAYDPEKQFLVASYHIGEVEQQVESSSLGARFTPYLIEQLNKNTDGYWRYSGPDVAYFYINCEGIYWNHVCDAEMIRGLVNQHKGKYNGYSKD